MRNIFNLDAPIIQWITKLSWVLWMGCLWFLCCIPLVTIGASTAALYRMVFNLREEGRHTARDFFRAFRENFKHATLIWLLLLVGAAVLAAGYYGAVLVEQELARLILVAVFCIVFLLWGFVLIYSFPLTCYFENTLKNTLSNALAISLRHWRQTILCFALVVLPVLLMGLSLYWFLRLMYCWLIIYPGLAAYWIAGILKPVFKGYSK